MAIKRISKWLVLFLASSGLVRSAEQVEVSLDLAAFPAGDYEMVQSFASQGKQQVNDQAPQATRMRNVFAYDLKLTRPGQAQGLAVATLRRVQIELENGGKVSYDSAGRPEDQVPILARQFRYIVGLSAQAPVTGRQAIAGFRGLDAGWDKCAAENPDMAPATEMNKQNYGDARLDRMLSQGMPFLKPLFAQAGGAGKATLAVGQTWKVTQSLPGLRGRPTDVEQTCTLRAIRDGYAVVGVTWKTNAMKPQFQDGKMATYGVNEDGQAELTFHAASGMLTELTSTTDRVDQVAIPDAAGKVVQTTMTTRDVKTFSLRPKAGQPGGTSPSSAIAELLGPQPAAQPAAQSPQDVAKAILAAYKARNVSEMMKYCREKDRAFFQQVADQGERHPRYSSLFGGWRGKSVEAWDGTVGETRYKRYPQSTEAWVAYGRAPESGEVFVVTLVLDDGKWRFMDLNERSKDTFEGAAAQP